MRNIGIVLAVCACTSAAWAGGDLPTVEIISPGAGECVNNGDEVFTGGILGGEAQPDPRSVPVRLRLTNPDGGPLSVTFSVDGLEISTERFDFPGGQNSADADFFLSAFGVIDGERLDLETIIRPLADPETTARDTVVFQLDRQPPTLFVDIVEIEDIPACPDEAPQLDYLAQDNSDPDPQVEIREEFEGCIRRQLYTVTDTCGNAQEYELVTAIPADPQDVTATLAGFRCGVDGLCVTDGPDAVPFAADERIGRGTVVFELDAPPGCIDGLEAVLMTAEEYVEECPAFEDLEVDENGLLINPCPFLIPGQAVEAPGDYVSRLVVSSCGEELIRDELPFTVVDRPVADAGGPYVGVQGRAIELDGRNARVAPELGGLVSYAWDLNDDGFFDSGELRDDINNNGVQDNWETDRGNDGFDFAVDDDGDGEIEPAEVFPVVGGVIGLVSLIAEEDGDLTIAFRVTAGNGAQAQDDAEVTVEDIDPDCQLAGPYEALEGEPVTLDASASSAGHPSDPIIAWNWDFGDGRGDQRGDDLPRPNHIYRESGEYTVTLGLEDIDSIAECQAQVVVQEVVPVVEDIEALGAEDGLVEGESVFFSAGNSRPGSDSDPIINYEWEIRRVGEAGPPVAEQSGAVLRNPEFVFADHGAYEVCLTVYDEDSDARGCIEVEILDLSPVAVCDGPAELVEGQAVEFSAEGSSAGGVSDPLQRIEWDFGDGEPPVAVVDLGAEGALIQQRTFDSNGAYEVTLTVFDEDNDATCVLQVQVADTRPTPALEVLYPAGGQSGFEGEPLEFDASGSVAGADEIVAYRWAFGDGTTEVTQEPFAQHTYGDDGNYQVQLVVVDADGSTESVSLVADVANRAPTVDLQSNELQVELGQRVDFVTVTNGVVPPSETPQMAALVADVDADLPPRVVEWNFGDGSEPVTNVRTSHRFGALGPVTVTVLVEDAAGDSAEAEFEIEVTAPAPRIAQLEPQVGREGEELVFDIAVDAPPLGEGLATVAVNIPGQPPGSDVQIEEVEGGAVVHFRWTPTFYQAGRYTLQVRAEAVEVDRSDRTRNVSIIVDEAGTPRLAAVGGTSGRGVLTVYDYGRDDFRAVAEVELGLGGAGLAAKADGRRVFVAVPGSNRVTVVRSVGNIGAVRRIPVGRAPAAVVGGMVDDVEYMFAINSGSNDISVIDAESLKVVATVDLAPLDGPSDAAWLPAGFDGLGGPALAVVSRRSGHIAIVDAAAAVAGDDALDGLIATGGVLTRVVASPGNGWLHVADAKARRVYRISAQDVSDEDDGALDGVSVAFAPRDLVHIGETLYVATGDALLSIEDGGGVGDADGLLAAQSLATADEQIIGGGALVVASPTRIENLAPANLGRLTSAGSSRVRRLEAFVARE